MIELRIRCFFYYFTSRVIYFAFTVQSGSNILTVIFGILRVDLRSLSLYIVYLQNHHHILLILLRLGTTI
jgi:hypothetical protein